MRPLFLLVWGRLTAPGGRPRELPAADALPDSRKLAGIQRQHVLPGEGNGQQVGSAGCVLYWACPPVWSSGPPSSRARRAWNTTSSPCCAGSCSQATTLHVVAGEMTVRLHTNWILRPAWNHISFGGFDQSLSESPCIPLRVIFL